MKRVCTIARTLVLAAVSVTGLVSAQTYPSKPIKLIVPTAPGGGYDFTGRTVADKLAAELGQPLVVENRVGSGTVVGTQVAASSPADGYTLLVGGLANLAFNPGLYDKLPYKATDFVPIGLVGSFSYTLVARKDLAQTTLSQVIEYARANPGKLSIGTAGTGTGQHVAAALLKSVANIDLLEVPYKGAQPVYTDMFGGRVDLLFDNSATAKPFIDGKRARAIVTSSAARDPLLPDVPTGKEAGQPELVLESWIGIFAPAATPAPVVEKLRAALAKVMKSTELPKRLETFGIRPLYLTQAQTVDLLKAEQQKWPQFLRKAGIKAE